MRRHALLGVECEANAMPADEFKTAQRQ